VRKSSSSGDGEAEGLRLRSSWLVDVVRGPSPMFAGVQGAGEVKM